MQVTIARQLGLEPTTVGNFFMNARRRSMDKWKDEDPKALNAAMQQQYSPGSSGVEHDDPDMDQDDLDDQDLDDQDELDDGVDDLDDENDQDHDEHDQHRVL